MEAAGAAALWRFGFVIGVCIIIYLLYCVHAFDRHDKEVEAQFQRLPGNSEEDTLVLARQEELHKILAAYLKG